VALNSSSASPTRLLRSLISFSFEVSPFICLPPGLLRLYAHDNHAPIRYSSFGPEELFLMGLSKEG
jgi:hypothetical protein